MYIISDYLPYLYNKPDNLDLTIDEKTVSELLLEAKRQSIYASLFNLLGDQLKEGNGPWEKLYWNYVSYNIRNQAAHQKLHKLLSDTGIRYVMLKGMASARYYPNPLYRTMGDVDFLVNKNDLDKTIDLLKSNNYDQMESGSHNFHLSFKKEGITFELHWACPGIPKEGRAAEEVCRYLSDIIDKAELYDGYMVPSDFHHGLVLLLHSASHMTTTGMGLRHLCDWAVFVKKFSDSDFRILFDLPLKEMGLWEYARVLTAVSVKYLGIDHKAWADGVDNETVDLIMQDIIDSGNFGVKDNQRINQAKLMRDDATRGVARGGFIKTLFRNMNVRAKKTMPITAKVPILLPLGWVVIGVNHLIHIREGNRPSIEISQTIVGAKKRSKIYSRMKLFEGENK